MRKLLKSTFVALFFLHFAVHAAVAAPRREASFDTAQAVCYSVQNHVNTLADFTYTRCWPALLKHGYGFLIISEKPVFSAPAAKKAWLLTVVGAVGKEMNDRGLSGQELMVSDVQNTTNRIGWSLPLEVATSLQRRAQREEITLEE